MNKCDPAEEVAHLIARLGGEFGFTYVDLYIPDGEEGELVAFTVSKSEKYVKAIGNVEVDE